MREEKVYEEIIIAGFGGQGILLAGRLLCIAAMREGKRVTHIPSYGAEMRGGTANCGVIISDDEIASPIVESPSILIALNEPSLRKFERKCAPGGLIIYNASLIKTEPIRSDLESRPIEANRLSEAEGSYRAANMAALGSLVALKPELCRFESLESALDEAISERNRRYNGINRKIMKAGYKAA